MRSVFLIALLLLLVRCGNGVHNQITFQGFTDSQQGAISDALNSLGAIQNHDVTFMEASLPYPILGESEVGVPHCQISISPAILDGSDVSNAVLRTVVWHEYGHCAGLYHDTDANAIMYYEVGMMGNYSNDEINKFRSEMQALGGLK